MMLVETSYEAFILFPDVNPPPLGIHQLACARESSGTALLLRRKLDRGNAN